jgi:hypothetical protein
MHEEVVVKPQHLFLSLGVAWDPIFSLETVEPSFL